MPRLFEIIDFQDYISKLNKKPTTERLLLVTFKEPLSLEFMQPFFVEAFEHIFNNWIFQLPENLVNLYAPTLEEIRKHIKNGKASVNDDLFQS